MVAGIERFRYWFRGYEDQYAIIGGTACDLLMEDEGLAFRGTKDIDLVLIIEAITPEFGARFWEFIREAGYEHRSKSTGNPQFYRFSHPTQREYPFMIELFSRKPDAIGLPAHAAVTPLPMEDDISSLSAILLDEAYYQFLRSGTTQVAGISVLDAAHLIPFKAKAWLDLSQRKANGEAVDSRSIRKHKNDVFRLFALLNPDIRIAAAASIYQDLREFLSKMETEDVDLKQLGVRRGKEEILSALMAVYYTEEQTI